ADRRHSQNRVVLSQWTRATRAFFEVRAQNAGATADADEEVHVPGVAVDVGGPMRHERDGVGNPTVARGDGRPRAVASEPELDGELGQVEGVGVSEVTYALRGVPKASAEPGVVAHIGSA